MKTVAGITGLFVLTWALAALTLGGCTGYRTYNSVYWAREAYKQGMAEVEQGREQSKGINYAYTRRAERQTQVPGQQFFEEAARKCLAFLAQAPEGRRSDDALILMGKAFFQLKRFIQAESSFSKLLNTQPKSKFRDDAQYYLVLIDLERGDIGLAELGIERLLDNFPKSKYRPQALFHLGRTLFEQGNYERAMEVLTGLSENYDDFDQMGDALSLIASIHFENTDYEQAHEIYLELYTKGDNEVRKWEGLIGMARSLSRMGEHEKALEHYNRALGRARFIEERAEARLGINVEYTYLGRYQEAKDGFELIIKDVPRTGYSAAAWYELGLLYKDYHKHSALLDSIVVDSLELLEFRLNSKTMEPLLELGQRLLSYKLSEMAFRGVRREDPNSVFLEASLDQAADVRDLFKIYEQIEASDSTTNRDALARLEFLLGENHEAKGEYQQARIRYERVLFEYPNTIWAPKAAINIAGVSELMGDSARARQAFELVVDNFPDTRYADRARGALGLPVQERPPNFYLDELMAYTPPRIERRAGPGEGLAPGARPVPGQESWLQMRRRLYWGKYGSAAGGGA